MLKEANPGAALATSPLRSAEIQSPAAPVANPVEARVKLSLVIPCYNEEKTLEVCVEKVLAIRDETLELELIVVDDCSKDASLAIGQTLAQRIPGLVILHHEKNQ